jgi:hypothetical protein
MDITVSTDVLGTTRLSLHTVAEHVLGAQQLASKGRIGLRQDVAGFATQPYPYATGERRLVVRGGDIVVEDDDLHGNRTTRRGAITTLRAAGELVGSEPGMGTEVYEPTTVCEVDRPLPVDSDAARTLADFLALAQATLTLWSADLADQDPAPIQLWPEHFDLATSIAEVNYGASAGDAGHALPYLYIGPWSPPTMGGYWNEPFGASLGLDRIDGVEDALDFFRDGHAALD